MHTAAQSTPVNKLRSDAMDYDMTATDDQPACINFEFRIMNLSPGVEHKSRPEARNINASEING